MRERYTHCGKQVLRNNGYGPFHFADVRTPAEAEAVTILLNTAVLLTSEATTAEAETVREVLWS